MNYLILFITITIAFILLNSILNQNEYFSNDENYIPIEDRLKYYMNNIYDKKVVISNKIYSNKNYLWNKNNKNNNEKYNYKIYKVNYDSINDIYSKNNKNYIKDINYISNIDKNKNKNNFQIALGDIKKICNVEGTIAKSRNIDDKNIVLLKLNYKRHWKNFDKVNKYDIEFNKKNNKIIWRGVTTGYSDKNLNPRYILVNKYYNYPNKNIDIGFSDIVQNRYNFKKYLKKALTIKEQLKSKYIISVEGNDVPTGIKWQLYSNSVVFMARPKVVSWLMEDKLIPNVHYILLKDDYSDLIEKYNWALKNDEKCIIISKNATNYMEQFLNKKREDIISSEIMNRYFNNVKFSD